MVSILQVVRGVALAGLITGGLFASTMVLGLSSGTNRVLFLFVGAAGLVFGLIDRVDSKWGTLGGAGVAAISIIGGSVSGFGWLEICGVVGGLIAVSILLRPPLSHHAVKTLNSPKLIGLAAIALVLVSLVPLVLDGGTLGHDESAYALKGRSWLEGTPETGWSIHRGPALSVYAYGALAVGWQETGLRVVGLTSLLALAFATWWLGSRLGGAWVGPLAASVVLAGPAIQRRATEFLTDIPAAALLIICMVLIWKDFQERDGPTYAVLWILPFAWLAFYLRYQSILAFGLVGLAVLIIWWRQIASRPIPLIVTAVLGLCGLLPHFVFSTAETGSPIGILQFTGRAPGREFIGEGVVDYAALLPWQLVGLLGFFVGAFLLWWIVASWRDRDERRRSLFLLIPALGQVLVLGLLSHGESRFVFFPLSFASVGAVLAAFYLSQTWRSTVIRSVRLMLVALLVGSLALSITSTRGSVNNRVFSNEPVELSADVVYHQAQGTDCGVLTSYTPQVTFYSLCSSNIFRPDLEAEEAVSRLEGGSRFMILIDHGRRQPEGESLEGLVALTVGDSIVVHGGRDSGEVFGFDDG